MNKRATEREIKRIERVLPPLLTKQQLADELGVSIRTITRWIHLERFPRPDVRLTPCTQRWKASTIERFLEEQRP